MKGKNIVLSIIILMIIAIILVLQNPLRDKDINNAKDSTDSGTKVNDLAPDLTFRTINGDTLKLSDLRGKGVILNAWAAWCPFCIDEMPDLQQISDERDDLTVIFVHRTRTESFDTASSYLEEFMARKTPITDPVVLDPEDLFYSTFFGFGMPVTLFIDKNGMIRDKKVGPMSLNEIKQRSEKIL